MPYHRSIGVQVGGTENSLSHLSYATNIETFRVETFGGGYFQIHELGHTYIAPAWSTLDNDLNYYTTLDYSQLGASLIFDLENMIISSGSVTDNIKKEVVTGSTVAYEETSVVLVGSNHGDVYYLDGTYTPIFTGTGNDSLCVHV